MLRNLITWYILWYQCTCGIYLAHTDSCILTTLFTLNFLNTDHDPLITQFGFYGNGLDQHTAYTSRYYGGGGHIFCGTGNSLHSSVDWFYTDGSRIGDTKRYLQVTYFPNGTAVLKIAENRSVHYCDGGTFTCIARSANRTESRNFTLIINSMYSYKCMIFSQGIEYCSLDF